MMGKSRPFVAALVLLAFISLGCGIIDRIRSNDTVARLTSGSNEPEATRRQSTPRPTFTPTPAYTATPTDTPTPTITPIPSETPTPVPTDTPIPTDTPTPEPPTNTPRPAPPPPTPTEGPPPPTATPDFPFTIVEQGSREFQKTNYNGIVIFAAAVDQNNSPIGDLKLVGNLSPGDQHAESPATTWNWSAANCLGCSYVKQGNVKFEPGPFVDGTWNIYLADGSGNQLSPTVSLSYATDANQWVWDFIIFKKK